MRLEKGIGFVLFVLFFISFQACKKKTKTDKATSDSEIVIASEDEVKLDKVKNCDDFIGQYQEWTEEYVAFLEKYKDNPVEAVSSPEYSKMMVKASSWSQNWLSLSVSCSSNSEYQKRFEEISDQLEEKVKALGFSK